MTVWSDKNQIPARTIFVLMIVLLIESTLARAEAELGPCTTAAPTTSSVVVFVTDINRSMDWYRDKAGLGSSSLSTVDRAGSRAVKMTRNGVGGTLVASSGSRDLSRDPQMVCFAIEGPPAPSSGSPPLFLVDPDGTSVELPAFSGPTER